jgi:hypothetical protein
MPNSNDDDDDNDPISDFHSLVMLSAVDVKYFLDALYDSLNSTGPLPPKTVALTVGIFFFRACSDLGLSQDSNKILAAAQDAYNRQMRAALDRVGAVTADAARYKNFNRKRN